MAAALGPLTGDQPGLDPRTPRRRSERSGRTGRNGVYDHPTRLSCHFVKSWLLPYKVPVSVTGPPLPYKAPERVRLPILVRGAI